MSYHVLYLNINTANIYWLCTAFVTNSDVGDLFHKPILAEHCYLLSGNPLFRLMTFVAYVLSSLLFHELDFLNLI